MTSLKLFDSIAKEILVDTYLSTSINIAEIKKLLLDTYQLEELNDIYSVDYIPVIFLAFRSEDVAEFFLFSMDNSIEEYKSRLIEKIDLIDIPSGHIKRAIITEYAITIVLYLELDLKIPVEYKDILLEILKEIIEINMVTEDMSGITIELNKAYKELKERYTTDGKEYK